MEMNGLVKDRTSEKFPSNSPALTESPTFLKARAATPRMDVEASATDLLVESPSLFSMKQMDRLKEGELELEF